MGVGSAGVVIYRDNVRINQFPWPLVLKMSYKNNNFDVKIRPAAVRSTVCLSVCHKSDNLHLTI